MNMNSMLNMTFAAILPSSLERRCRAMARLSVLIPSVLATFAMITSPQAKTPLEASGLVDLKPLIGTITKGCFGGPAYDVFAKSLAPGFPINLKRQIKIVAPPGIAEVLGKPAVTDKGEYIEFVVPVSRGRLSGLRVTQLILDVGKENGIHVESIALDAPKAAVQAAFKSELAEAGRWKKSQPKDSEPATFKVEVEHGRTQLVCNRSD
jgi:hypothetical protein